MFDCWTKNKQPVWVMCTSKRLKGRTGIPVRGGSLKPTVCFDGSLRLCEAAKNK